MKKIIFATKNPDKLREIREILGEGYELMTMKEAGLDPEIIENGRTFEENALIKVRAIGVQPDAVVMADDSGLCIDAFGGGPGVYSARFLGEKTDYGYKNAYVLDKMKGLPEEERGAHYTCVIAALLPDGRELTAEGRMDGIISKAPAGARGFGYDPVFYLPEYGKTAAQITAEEKNEISHRGRALKKMKQMLEEAD